MGISRDSAHKRRKTGGRNVSIRKKRKFEMGRPPANTKICSGGEKKRISLVRTRGGNYKHRGLKLETGNFSWPTQSCTRRTRVLNVQYHATSNELVRTNTLVKGSIIQIDATPFKTWFQKYYNENLGKKEDEVEQPVERKLTSRMKKRLIERQSTKSVEDGIQVQFKTGRLYAKITSRPGQCGRVDGYVLEGEELLFYHKKILERKKKA